MRQNQFCGWGCAPDPTGKLTALPISPSWIWGGRGGQEKGGEVKGGEVERRGGETKNPGYSPGVCPPCTKWLTPS